MLGLISEITKLENTYKPPSYRQIFRDGLDSMEDILLECPDDKQARFEIGSKPKKQILRINVNDVIFLEIKDYVLRIGRLRDSKCTANISNRSFIEWLGIDNTFKTDRCDLWGMKVESAINTLAEKEIYHPLSRLMYHQAVQSSVPYNSSLFQVDIYTNFDSEQDPDRQMVIIFLNNWVAVGIFQTNLNIGKVVNNSFFGQNNKAEKISALFFYLITTHAPVSYTHLRRRRCGSKRTDPRSC